MPESHDRPAAPKRYRPPPRVAAYEAGYDAALYDVGCLLVDLRDEGASDAAQLDAVLELVGLRMMTGAPDPVRELTGEAR